MAHNAPFGTIELQQSYETYDDYVVRFYNDNIRTTVTNNSSIVARWISEIERFHRDHRRRCRQLIVGLDVEWRPSFNRYIQHPVATLQLCVGHRCLIYQLIHAGSIPACVVDFLSNRNNTLVGIGIHQDLEKLEEDYELGISANAVDLRPVAAEVCERNDLRNAGMKLLATVVLDREVEKPRNVTLSRWDAAYLSYDQVKYACIDAFVSFEIGRILDSRSGFASG